MSGHYRVDVRCVGKVPNVLVFRSRWDVVDRGKIVDQLDVLGFSGLETEGRPRNRTDEVTITVPCTISARVCCYWHPTVVTLQHARDLDLV